MSSRNRNVMSQVRRGESYSVRKIRNFLTIMKMVLPLSRCKWDTVEEIHCKHYGDKHRIAASIKKKYKKLVKEGPVVKTLQIT
mgnify:CR=1 FL=1